MTRPLEVVGGLSAPELTARLRAALSNDGPALLPREAGVGAVPSSQPRVPRTGVGAGPSSQPRVPRTGVGVGPSSPPRVPRTDVVESTDDAGVASRGAVGRSTGSSVPLGDAGAGAAVPLPREVPKAVALVIETSGSTGVPKRVALSADALLASAAASEQALGGPGQWLLALPTHYVAGVQVLVRSIAAGSQPVVHPPGHFSPETFAALAGRLELPLRFSSLVPAQLARLVEAAEGDREIRRAVARLDAILIGGQALPDPLRERAIDLGFAVVRTYGASETAGGCVYDGQPIGRTVVRLNAGELEIAGPSLAEGYLGDDELTAARFHGDEGLRWYRTSDAGTIVDGVVTVTGRLDDLIISGGIKVSLGRVERLVQAQPGFEQAVVVPRESDRWGQVGVVVTESPSAAASADTSTEDATAVSASTTGARGAPAVEAASTEWPVVELAGPRLERLREAVVAAAGRASAPAALVHVRSLPRLSSGKPDRVLIERLVAAGAPGVAPSAPVSGAARAVGGAAPAPLPGDASPRE
jgi:O-succinylbenzoic acid--CoA ligase